MRCTAGFLLLFFLVGCAAHELPSKELVALKSMPEAVQKGTPSGGSALDEAAPEAGGSAERPIADLQEYPQNAAAYADNIRSRSMLLGLQQAYKKHYFLPWGMEKPPETLESIMWPFQSYRADDGCYGENLKLLPKSWFDEMLDASNFKTYGTQNRYAITLRFSHLRNFPTHKPLFKDPKEAGEGYPFDYMQNSGIHANEPLFVSHYSKDGAWVYVFSSYATGWLPLHGIAFIAKEETEKWQNAKQLHIVSDGYPIKDGVGRFVFYGRLGIMLPLIKVNKEDYTVLTVTAGVYNKPTFTKAKIPKHVGREEPLPLDHQNLPKLANEVLQSNYGWGGLYEERDCSSTLRDFYAPFGIWLPRNSFQQAHMGKVFSLKEMSREEKLSEIKTKGIPFETFLYRKGHILLYLGEYQGRPMVMHNVWGIKTKKEEKNGRKIIGKTVISTLDLGCKQPDYDKENNLLDKLESMNIITAGKKHL